MLYAEDACQICGTGITGTHPECEARALAIEAEFKADDQEMLKECARFCAYGIHSDDSRESLARAIASLTRYLGYAPEFDEEELIEGDDWWFVSHGWIGVIGFVVEKSTDRIFSIGSGLGAISQRRYVRWVGIDAYLAGRLKPV